MCAQPQISVPILLAGGLPAYHSMASVLLHSCMHGFHWNRLFLRLRIAYLLLRNCMPCMAARLAAWCVAQLLLQNCNL